MSTIISNLVIYCTKLFFSQTTPLIEHISHKYIPLRLLVLSMDDLLNSLPATIKNAIQKQKKKNQGYIQTTFEITMNMYNGKELV